MTGTKHTGEGLDARRRKLLFRSWHRGMREMDLILGQFADNELAGIDGADLEGLFNRHETAARVGDTGSSSAGLGLAIARRIAELHGSALELESRPGVGTRVGFTLPRAVLRAAEPQTHGSTP